MNIRSKKMKSGEYRHGLVTAQIEMDLPFQIRALRLARKWTQPELAARAGMKQSRISAMETPGGAHFTLETLRRLAEAFDVALVVRFAPFSELLNWNERFSPDHFEVPSFDGEVRASTTPDPEPLPVAAGPKSIVSALRGLENRRGALPSPVWMVPAERQTLGQLPY